MKDNIDNDVKASYISYTSTKFMCGFVRQEVLSIMCQLQQTILPKNTLSQEVEEFECLHRLL